MKRKKQARKRQGKNVAKDEIDEETLQFWKYSSTEAKLQFLADALEFFGRKNPKKIL